MMSNCLSGLRSTRVDGRHAPAFTVSTPEAATPELAATAEAVATFEPEAKDEPGVSGMSSPSVPLERRMRRPSVSLERRVRRPSYYDRIVHAHDSNRFTLRLVAIGAAAALLLARLSREQRVLFFAGLAQGKLLM